MALEDIYRYYNLGQEQGRLTRSGGRLEFARTQEIALRYLPTAPATILDVGGGAGIYALWLAELGYEVHLIDLMPLHIEQATNASQQAEHPLASLRVGDARKLDFPDASADVLLLCGPLYHLPDYADRIAVLREAYRVLKPSGIVLVAAISRVASTLEGLAFGYLADDNFAEVLEATLKDGTHSNPTGEPGYFTTAYFHEPAEIPQEIAAAGFQFEAVIPVEGPAGFTREFDRFWDDPVLRERLLKFVRLLEKDPALMAATGHLIGVGRKA
jgi:ubiquinone/menaquinone biosynthesis C-methylase UbiE